MPQYLMHTTWLDGKSGLEGKSIRLTLKPIAPEDILDAMENNFHEFSSGIVTESFANELIRDFGLSFAHGESYHTGLSVFKKYE